MTLKKAKKRLITQRDAAEELGFSVRHVKRLLYGLKKHGDKAVVHGLRGKPSNRKIDKSTETEAVRILSAPVYQGFGPTLAAEYLANKHAIEVSKETLAVDLIHQVGPGGNFLNEMHTAEHFRDEVHLSPLFPAQTWEAARVSAAQFDTVPRATQIAREFWREPERPVLSDDQCREMDKIVKKATGL